MGLEGASHMTTWSAELGVVTILHEERKKGPGDRGSRIDVVCICCPDTLVVEECGKMKDALYNSIESSTRRK